MNSYATMPRSRHLPSLPHAKAVDDADAPAGRDGSRGAEGLGARFIAGASAA